MTLARIQITEPMTMATDYLLVVSLIILARLLWKNPDGVVQATRRWWAGTFALSALAAAIGGTYHGFKTHIPELVVTVVGRGTLVAIVGASACLLFAVILNRSPTARKVFWGRVVVTKAIVSLLIALTLNVFWVVVADYLLSMVIVGWVYKSAGGQPRKWVLAGIGIALVAAMIQVGRLAPHPSFNHNDLYHMIQLFSFYLLYRGARLSTDRARMDT